VLLLDQTLQRCRSLADMVPQVVDVTVMFLKVSVLFLEVLALSLNTSRKIAAPLIDIPS
jgi:hypothetical protein